MTAINLQYKSDLYSSEVLRAWRTGPDTVRVATKFDLPVGGSRWLPFYDGPLASAGLVALLAHMRNLVEAVETAMEGTVVPETPEEPERWHEGVYPR